MVTVVEHVPTLLLCIPDNPKGSSILHATTWILEFSLTKDSASRLFREPLKVNLETAESENSHIQIMLPIRLTRGVFPTAPVKPLTAFVVNALHVVRCLSKESIYVSG